MPTIKFIPTLHSKPALKFIELCEFIGFAKIKMMSNNLICDYILKFLKP